MKAVFLAPELEVGGVERLWTTLVPELSRRGVAAEVVTVTGRGPVFEELAAAGVRCTCLGVQRRLSISAWRTLAALASRRPDAILTTGVNAHVLGLLASRRAGSAHIASIHSIAEQPMPVRQRWILRAIAPRVDAATAVTSAQIPFLESLGVPRERIHVVPNGVRMDPPTRSREAVRRELGASDESFLVLLVAALRPEKRVARFVDAVVAANWRESRVRGVIAGGGPELEDIRRRCQDTDGVVTALGPRRDVPDLLAAAEAACLTSDAEALPLFVLEAMSHSLPVVAPDVGGLRDAVVHDETGLLVPVGDHDALVRALLALAGDRELAARLGEAGRERHRERFTVDEMVDAHFALLDRVATPRATARRPVPRET
jgi:glycosyltransferase involved in cell wall biosynthesis